MTAQDPPSDATACLRRLAKGDESAGEQLLPLIYEELHRLARHHMAPQSAAHTLQPTALLHEAWMRLAGSASPDWQDREHFLSFASRVMRNVLIDHARRRSRAKRGGDRERVPLDMALDQYEVQGVDVLALDEALASLGEQDPQLMRLVELRFFGGLTMEETARVLETSLSSVERSWRLARIWLRDALGGADES